MQREIAGIGSIGALPDAAGSFPFRSVFLVTGTVSFDQPAIREAVATLTAGLPWSRYAEFERNPRADHVERGVELLARLAEPLVVAIGGGSVLDMAKAIRFFHARGVRPGDYFARRDAGDPKASLRPMIAVPTTAGTGSEATCFATIYLEQRKHSVDDPSLRPEVAILDPALTYTLPPPTTAETGIDALAQAIESYWSIRSTDTSWRFAAEAIVLLAENLERAVCDPTPAVRAAMLRGAHLAGKAIDITRTTAPHAISYPMTAHFGIPHGRAVAVSLPHFVRYNAGKAEVRDPRGEAHVRDAIDSIVRLLGYASVAEAEAGLTALMRKIGVATTLDELGIPRSGWHLIVRDGFTPERMGNNPRVVTEESLRELLAEMGEGGE